MTKTSGIILIDKPLNITSRQALFEVQKRLNCGRLGHTGTLDPLATGLLVMLCGQARKLQNFLTLDTKKYDTVICLGANSDTDDSEGPIHKVTRATPPTPQKIQDCLKNFQGKISQIPPQFSAIKIKGKRAYKHARNGEKINIPSREVHIHSIKVLAYEYPYLTLNVHCGSGTYIRSLARDLGKELETGGYVHALHRTSVGNFDITNAISIDESQCEKIMTLEDVLASYPRIDLQSEHLYAICNGQKVYVPGLAKRCLPFPSFVWIEGKVVAIAKINADYISTQKLLIID